MLVQKARGSPWTIVGWRKEGPLEAGTMVCGTNSLFSGPLQCVPPVLGVRRLWVQGSACAVWGCCTPECCLWSGAFPWGESLGHFYVPSPTACAEAKGGSVLTSPCQNPTESSGMRTGGRSAAKGVIFVL